MSSDDISINHNARKIPKNVKKVFKECVRRWEFSGSTKNNPKINDTYQLYYTAQNDEYWLIVYEVWGGYDNYNKLVFISKQTLSLCSFITNHDISSVNLLLKILPNGHFFEAVCNNEDLGQDCKLRKVDSDLFLSTKDFKRSQEFLDSFTKNEVTGEFLVYREYPNGGRNEDIKSYLVSLKDIEDNSLKYSSQGKDFNLISMNKISNRPKRAINQIIEEIGFGTFKKDCECDGGTDGVILYFDEKQNNLIFGIIYTCHTPEEWNANDESETHISKLIGLIKD